MQSGLWVLVPVLNEEEGVGTRFGQLLQVAAGLDPALLDRVRFCWIDSGSRDRSAARIAALIGGLDPRLKANFELIETGLTEPSVGRALNHAISRIGPGDFLMVHPVDCSLGQEGWSELLEWFEVGKGLAAAFPKTYTSRSRVLRIYGGLLNALLLRRLGWWVWTNLPCVRRDVIGPEGLETPGFLEDLLLSDRIRQASRAKKFPVRTLASQVLVSSRRYDRDGIAARILLNGWITFLFVSGLASIERLKKMYVKKG